MADLNDGRVDLHRSRGRFVAFGVAAVILLLALGGRLFQLQVVKGDEYARRAAADRTVEVPLPAPRGLDLRPRGRPLAVNTPSWTVKVRPADLPDTRRARVLARVARVTGARPAGAAGSGSTPSAARRSTSSRSSAASAARRR